MSHRVRTAAALISAGLLLSACHGSLGTSTSKSAGGGDQAGDAKAGAIATGPGPQAHYAVQPQPSPDACHYGSDKGQPLPDPRCTPGAVSPAVTQADLSTTICRPSGYTTAIRPPADITGQEKKANARSYDHTGSMRDAEYDHLISLELGGDPDSPLNLWVEPPSPGHRVGAGPNNPKDVVESKLHTAVCSGKVTLRQAQQVIATDWPEALAKLGLS